MARVLELLAAGVQVRIGSDNINDITSPAGTADLMDEVFMLSNVVRFYDMAILAKIAAGVPLDIRDRQTIRAHLDTDLMEIGKSIEQTRKK
jgi:hypothetical protein